MTSAAQSASTPAQNNDTGMRSEISQKWGKITAQEIAALKNKDDLVTQVQSKYQLDKAQAQKDVDAFAKGRNL
jgi:pyruvoyl-dependent arginine decarboxylase (PvlArgDC)